MPTESEIKPTKMKRPHKDIDKKPIFRPPSPSHISDTLEATPSPSSSGVGDRAKARFD